MGESEVKEEYCLEGVVEGDPVTKCEEKSAIIVALRRDDIFSIDSRSGLLSIEDTIDSIVSVRVKGKDAQSAHLPRDNPFYDVLHGDDAAQHRPIHQPPLQLLLGCWPLA